MAACLILGDSLAAGVAAARPDCHADTRSGIGSAAYVSSHLVAASADIALISLGANDGEAGRATAEHLVQLREGLTARRVYWLLPARPASIRQLLLTIAAVKGDRTIETRGWTGADGLHLGAATYRTIGGIFDLPP